MPSSPPPPQQQPAQTAAGYRYDVRADESGAEAHALGSPRVIVPMLHALFEPRRVVDVGCGLGHWLKVWSEQPGVSEVRGLDGAWVPVEKLRIAREAFTSCDLNVEPLPVGGQRFDLALNLEVAEHLPAAAAGRLVDSLTALAPVVGFSAAVPGQGGFGHIHERWQDHWIGEFARRGFRAFDLIRPRVWSDPRVIFCYAQNLLIYVDEAALARERPEIAEKLRAAKAAAGPFIANVVHPEMYGQTRHQLDSLRGTLWRVPVLIGRALKRRLRKRRHDPAAGT